MSWKSTWVLLVLAAGLAGYAIWVEHPMRVERAREASRWALPGLKPDEVTNVSLTLRGQPVIEARRDKAHQWLMTAPVVYPAYGAKIERLLKGLSELQWQDRIPAAELSHRRDAAKEYGFDQPRYALELQSAGASRRLEIGNITALGDQLFVKVAGSHDIYEVGVALTNDLPLNENYWRDTKIVNLEGMKIEGIEARSPGRSLDLSKDTETGLWNMTKPVQARADSPKVEELLRRLDALRVVGFGADNPSNLDRLGLQTPAQTPQLELSLLRGTNTVFDLMVGTNLPNLPAYAYARRRDPSNIVAIATAGLLPWEGDSTNFLDRHLFSRPASNIEAIAVTGDDSFGVKRKAGGWEVSDGKRTFAADAFFVGEWLEGLTNVDLSIEKMVEANVAPYGLAQPQLDYKVMGMGGGSNEVLAEIQFGSNAPGGVFERRTDESAVNVMPADAFGRLPHASWQLRDRQIWNFAGSNVVSIAVHYLGGERKYLRDPSGQWTLGPGYHGPTFQNTARLEEGLHRLGQLRAVYWDAVGEDPSDKFGIRAADHRVTLGVRVGGEIQTREVEFGKRSPYLHPYAAVELDGQRLIFEFPVDLFDSFIAQDFTIPVALRLNP